MALLTDALEVGGLRLANRLVMPPMVVGLAEGHGPSEEHLEWYARYAACGVGLVIVESTAIGADGLLVENEFGAWDDAQVAGLARLADTIHAAGRPAVVQIVHGGARSWRPDPAVERVGPSPVRLMPGPAPRALTIGEIEGLVESFAAAARRVVAAGFDGVEVHAAHYYLLSEFLSPYCNRRDDRYGGDLGGRARFLLEVLGAVRAQIGSAALFVRMHCRERVEGGLSEDDAVVLAEMLEHAGVDVIDASAIGESKLAEDEDGAYLSASSALARTLPGGDNLAATARLKRAVAVPVIAVGKLAEGDVAARALAAGQADLIAIGRQLLADPDCVRKLLDGRGEEIVRCRDCFRCYASIRSTGIRCSVNRSLRERRVGAPA